MSTQRRTDRVTTSAAGSGSFLDPPTYPTHDYGIELDTNRPPEDRGWASLTSAVDGGHDWLHPDTVADAKRILEAWRRPAIDNPEIQDWIAQVLGYFRHCYCGLTDTRWNVSDLIIDDRNPLENIDDHAGVHLIRKFYPDFTPTAEDFQRSYWGTKPEQVPA